MLLNIVNQSSLFEVYFLNYSFNSLVAKSILLLLPSLFPTTLGTWGRLPVGCR